MARNMHFSRLPLRQLTYASSPILRTRPGLTPIATPILQQTRLRSSDSMPKIAQSSVWTAMIPNFILDRIAGRRGSKNDTSKSKEWNPASFYIIIFILIGSQAIRMLALRNDYTAYTRSTDAKIQLLREVIERVQRGEKVDVEKLLGTGDAAKEREWEEGMSMSLSVNIYAIVFLMLTTMLQSSAKSNKKTRYGITSPPQSRTKRNKNKGTKQKSRLRKSRSSQLKEARIKSHRRMASRDES